MKETLRKFLVKHRCYRSFYKNYKDCRPTESFDAYLKRNEKYLHELIDSAFEWAKTDQGVHYWWLISNKWNEYLKLQEINKNNND